MFFAAPIALADEAFFETRIRPILAEHCYSCHSADAKIVRGGLRLDTKHGTLAGGDSGAAVVPGNVGESLILTALKHESFEMPPQRKLPDEVIADFERWIEQGAHDPRSDSVAPDHRLDPRAVADHWAFQRIDSPSVPAPDVDWVQNPVDAFVLDKLTSRGWQPAPNADKYTLLRRATFDLTGLPPTLQEIESFVADDSPESFHKVIDRLLASPSYGQRWGRHWLDLVRYADTNGADENHDTPNAWRYRDWVFEMLNRDLPLDDFIVHQIAGDLLCDGEDEQTAGELITATGMLVIGPKMLAEQDKEKMRIDIVDEQIDTVSRTMLGMTIACARCHDHKFDPIKAEDYYALAGIFASTRTMLHNDFVSKWMERDLPSKQIDSLRSSQQQKIDAAKQLVDQLVAAANRELLATLATETLPEQHEGRFPEDTKKMIADAREILKKQEDAMPKYESVMAVTDDKPTDVPVHVRGSHLNKLETPTPRGAPARLTEAAAMTIIPSDHSGRLQLAHWFVSPDQPLTARVMVNRIWMWHFGQPLMRSPSNFGLQSDPPVHRELLDHLARRLIEDGWSLKNMHRLIMRSNTYRMSSRSRAYESEDPENNTIWRQNRRRLEIEPLRDALLFAGDSLDQGFGGPPLDNGSLRRTVYLKINRAALFDFLSTFDYVETANHLEQRPVTTVPNQALFLMNNRLVHTPAATLAQKTLEWKEDAPDRIEQLWLRLFGRPPDDRETKLAISFLADSTDLLTQRSDPWEVLCRTLMAGSGFSYVE